MSSLELKPIFDFAASDVDDAGATKYYGMLDREGNWYIIREDTAAGQFRYATKQHQSGESSTYPNYTDAWDNRATLVYDYFNVVF